MLLSESSCNCESVSLSQVVTLRHVSVSQNITIIVDDANDWAPTFTTKNYGVSMPEELPVGSSVTFVKATDRDIGYNARLTYTVVSSRDGSNFYMDSIYAAGTGVIKVAQVGIKHDL